MLGSRLATLEENSAKRSESAINYIVSVEEAVERLDNKILEKWL